MSYADQVFKTMCENIIENGTDTKGELVRPKWPDGTSAYTIKQFGVVNRYDLRKEFPALTFRKTALKSAMDEILWIWQKKSNNIKDLNSHIWDEWADENGSIGKAYGYQLGLKHPYKDVTEEKARKVFGNNIGIMYIGDRLDINSIPITKRFHIIQDRDNPIWYMDQVDRVLYDLKVNPFSRRILTSIYNHADLSEMALSPCCWSVTLNVTQSADGLVLNMMLTQRSQDILAANNWNVCQYAILLMMLAQVSGMIPGELVHCIADAHIYDRHVPIVKELIQRESFPAPKVYLNPEVKDFYAFTTKDLIVEDYKYGPQVEIPIAI